MHGFSELLGDEQQIFCKCSLGKYWREAKGNLKHVVKHPFQERSANFLLRNNQNNSPSLETCLEPLTGLEENFLKRGYFPRVNQHKKIRLNLVANVAERWIYDMNW